MAQTASDASGRPPKAGEGRSEEVWTLKHLELLEYAPDAMIAVAVDGRICRRCSLGLIMMIVGLGLGVTMIMLPVGIAIGLLGVAVLVGGLFAHIDETRG
jgi:hypothetical protein